VNLLLALLQKDLEEETKKGGERRRKPDPGPVGILKNFKEGKKGD
jgi:hypothetical protein